MATDHPPDVQRTDQEAVSGKIESLSYTRLPHGIRCGHEFPLEGQVDFTVSAKEGIPVEVTLELFLEGRSIGKKAKESAKLGGSAIFSPIVLVCREDGDRCYLNHPERAMRQLTAEVTLRKDDQVLDQRTFQGPYIRCMKTSGIADVELFAPETIECEDEDTIQVVAHYLAFPEDRIRKIEISLDTGQGPFETAGRKVITDIKSGHASVEAEPLTVRARCWKNSPEDKTCRLKIGSVSSVRNMEWVRGSAIMYFEDGTQRGGLSPRPGKLVRCGTKLPEIPL
ncbi:MAG: hypothetical protein ACE5KH_00245 [Candidatus Geothermarchaeales archaeon]